MQKIKKGDEVVVITGKDAGKRGKVLKVASNGKLLVENIHLVKKHVRPDPNRGVEGGVVSKEAFIDISNVALWNPLLQKGDRVGIKTLDDGRKVRYFKSNDEVVDAL